MGKKEKKLDKLNERLRELENELIKELTQKRSDTAEISLSAHRKKIEAVQKQILALIA